MILGLYRAATFLGAPLIDAYLARRLKAGKEDAARFSERKGVASLPRPKGALIWLHGASVGEAISALPVIEKLRVIVPDATILLTTGTVASARLMEARLPKGVLHQYAPVDRKPWVSRFLDHWRPDLAIWFESEFWPNLLVETSARAVPMLLLNGRVSDRSFAGWKRYPGFAANLLERFALCLGQTKTDAKRLAALGASKAFSLGNLKFAAPPLPADADEIARLQATLGARPLWLAASTHPGEEDIAGQVHKLLQRARPDALTIIAPRHPARGADIAASLRAQGLKVAQRSANEPVAVDSDIYLADTMGELGIFYRLAPVVFMGKSLAGSGGQNPLEPARLGAAVLFGPRMDNFADIADRMAAQGAAEIAPDADGLACAVARLLGDASLLQARGDAAKNFARTEADALEAVMDAIKPFLSRFMTPSDART